MKGGEKEHRVGVPTRLSALTTTIPNTEHSMNGMSLSLSHAKVCFFYTIYRAISL
jgi:hypothetical protein